jgi:hypothetical protein
MWQIQRKKPFFDIFKTDKVMLLLVKSLIYNVTFDRKNMTVMLLNVFIAIFIDALHKA